MDKRLEPRYIVLKLSHLSTQQLDCIVNAMHENGIKGVDAVSIEHDWPEYTPVVDMLMGRVKREHAPGCDNDVPHNVCSRKTVPCPCAPDGWQCTRPRWHEGPCAAVKV